MRWSPVNQAMVCLIDMDRGWKDSYQFKELGQSHTHIHTHTHTHTHTGRHTHKSLSGENVSNKDI